MNRESQKLVPTRNFSHLEPQKLVPANHKKSPIRKIKLPQNFHATRLGFKIWQVPSLAKWTKIKISQYHWTIIMYRCKTRVFVDCKNFKRKIICHLKCNRTIINYSGHCFVKCCHLKSTVTQKLTIAFFAAVNHLNGPLRKQNFTLTGSKGQGLWFVIGGFRSVLCVSVFQGSLLVIVIMIDGSEKRNCEGGFWTLEFACLWKAHVKITNLLRVVV